MPRKNPRDYRLTDADLMRLASTLKTFVERDADDFAARLVGATQLAELSAAHSALSDILDDGYFQAMCTDAQAKVNAIRSDAADRARVIRSMAELAFPDDGRYAAFGFGKMASLSDADYHRALRRVVRVAKRFLTVLAPHGLTLAMADDLAAYAANLDDALEILNERVEDRFVGTAERVSAGNALYAIVSRLCSIGRSLFYSTDEARYNDYLLPS